MGRRRERSLAHFSVQIIERLYNAVAKGLKVYKARIILFVYDAHVRDHLLQV